MTSSNQLMHKNDILLFITWVNSNDSYNYCKVCWCL